MCAHITFIQKSSTLQISIDKLPSTALGTLSLTLGVQLISRLSENMLDTISLLTCMYLQLHACEPYRNNYAVVEPHADTPEVLYCPAQIHGFEYALDSLKCQ